MPLEWSYNIIYHFLCLLKNPASWRSTFAVSGGFWPLTKDCCKALSMWLTRKEDSLIALSDLFSLQLTSSRAIATQGWWTGSDRGQVGRAGHVSAAFTLDLMLPESVPAAPQPTHQCRRRVMGSPTAPESDVREPMLLQRRAAGPGPAAAKPDALPQADGQNWTERPAFHPRYITAGQPRHRAPSQTGPRLAQFCIPSVWHCTRYSWCSLNVCEAAAAAGGARAVDQPDPNPSSAACWLHNQARDRTSLSTPLSVQ